MLVDGIREASLQRVMNNRVLPLASDKVFRAFWHGGPLSPLAWACLSSFVAHGCPIELYCYDDLDVPMGVCSKPAAQIVPRERLFRLCDSYAAFSDLFRYQVIMKEGGWWVDTDVLLTGIGVPDVEFAFAEEEPGSINGAILKFPRGHFALKIFLEEVDRVDLANYRWGDIGPALLTRILKEIKYDSRSLPREALYPVHWLECYKFLFREFVEEIDRRTSKSPFVHMWAATFRNFGFDEAKDQPPTGSFLDALYRRYGIYDLFELANVDNAALRATVNKYLDKSWTPDSAAKAGLNLPKV